MFKERINTSNGIVHKKTSGYDIPLTGLHNGHFYPMHIIAMVSIFSSLAAGIIVIIVSFTNPKRKTKRFFSWSKCERFSVYMAVCDCFFNISHFMDHFHIALARDHVRPIELCSFYASMILEFVTSQVLMVNIVAVNIFVLIISRRDLHFGRFDWKLLSWMFGFPVLFLVIAISTKSLGPNGFSCFFDSINGWLAEILITTSPLTLIFLTNSILYLVVWYRIRSEERDIELFIGTNGTRIRKSHRAAKRMSLFVIAFLVQWFSLVLNGLWRGLAAIPAPDALFYAVTILPNIGGVLNGVVYYIIRPKGSERNGSEERTILSSKSISV